MELYYRILVKALGGGEQGAMERTDGLRLPNSYNIIYEGTIYIHIHVWLCVT